MTSIPPARAVTPRAQAAPRRHSGVVAVSALVIAGLLYSAAFIRPGDRFVHDDHGLRQLHIHLAKQTGPGSLLTAWNRHVNAGSPLFLLYPPGATLLGLGIHHATFHLLDEADEYNLLLILALILPGLTTYPLLRRLRLSTLSSSAGAFMAMTWFSLTASASDVQGGVVVGMINARLAMALSPLLVGLALEIGASETRSLGRSVAFGLLLGLQILFHPWKIILPVAALTLSLAVGTVRREGDGAIGGLATLALALITAFGLASPWLLPTIGYRELSMRGILWPHPWWLPLLVVLKNPPALMLGALGCVHLLRRPPGRRGPAPILVSLLPLLYIAYLANDVVLVERFGLELCEPRRMVDDFVFWLIVLSGFGFEALEALFRGPEDRRPARAFRALVALAVLLFSGYYPVVGIRHLARSGLLHYSAMGEKYGLSALWRALERRTGRVLFTGSALYADRDEDPDDHSHIHALTPLFTGLEIIGGTPTQHTPISALLYSGSASERNSSLAENRDGRSLFGMALDEDFDCSRLARYFCLLNVESVVVPDRELAALAALRACTFLEAEERAGRFFCLNVRGFEPSLAEIDSGRAVLATPARHGTGLRIPVLSSRAGATLRVKVTSFPQWRAEVNGAPLQIRADPWGLIIISGLPEGKDYTIEMNLETGPMEKTGAGIGILTLVSAAVGILIGRRKRNRELKMIGGGPDC